MRAKGLFKKGVMSFVIGTAMSGAYAGRGTIVVQRKPLSVIRGGPIENWLMLIEADIDVTACDKYGITLLHTAVLNRNKDAVVALIEAGADVNAKTNKGLTPLHYAAINGFDDIAHELIGHDAAVNARDKDGKTALHLAALFGHVRVVRKLLAATGINVKVRDNDKKTPIYYAYVNGYWDITMALHDKITRVTAYRNSGEGVFMKTNGLLKRLVFMLAVVAATSGVRAMQKGGMVVDKAIADVTSMTQQEKDARLFDAIKRGNIDDVRAALDAGANPDARDQNYWSPLMWAACCGSGAIVRVLLETLEIIRGDA